MFIAILFNKLSGESFANEEMVHVRTCKGESPYKWDFEWSNIHRKTTDIKEAYKLALKLAKFHNCKVYDWLRQDWDELTIEWLESKLQEL